MIFDPVLRAFDCRCRNAAVDDLSIKIHSGLSFRANHMDMNGRVFVALHPDDPVRVVMYLAHDDDYRETISPRQEELKRRKKW